MKACNNFIDKNQETKFCAKCGKPFGCGMSGKCWCYEISLSDEALKEIESGGYGFCESCGIEIGIRRLEARPTATLCIDCKTLDEIREKQMG